MAKLLMAAVEPRLRHKNQKIMAAGPDLELPVVRSVSYARTYH